MEKINLEGDHVPWPDGGLERTWPVLEPMKLTYLLKNMWDPPSQQNPHP